MRFVLPWRKRNSMRFVSLSSPAPCPSSRSSRTWRCLTPRCRPGARVRSVEREEDGKKGGEPWNESLVFSKHDDEKRNRPLFPPVITTEPTTALARALDRAMAAKAVSVERECVWRCAQGCVSFRCRPPPPPLFHPARRCQAAAGHAPRQARPRDRRRCPPARLPRRRRQGGGDVARGDARARARARQRGARRARGRRAPRAAVVGLRVRERERPHQ